MARIDVTAPYAGAARPTPQHPLPHLEAWALARQELRHAAPKLAGGLGDGAYRRFRTTYDDLCC